MRDSSKAIPVFLRIQIKKNNFYIPDIQGWSSAGSGNSAVSGSEKEKGQRSKIQH